MNQIQSIEKPWLKQPVIARLKPTHRRFRLKMTGSLVTATALVIVSLSLALLALLNSTSGLEKQKRYFERAQVVYKIEQAHGKMVSSVLDYNLTGNLASLKEYQHAEVATNEALSSFIPASNQYLLYTSLQNYLVSLNEVLTTVTQLYDKNQDKEAIFLWRTKGSPLSTSSRAFAEQLIKLELQKAFLEFTAATDDARNTAWLVIGLAGCALLLLTLTIHKRAENALRTERDFALQVMNTIGQGLTVVDPSLRFQFVNTTFARLVGFTQTELKGKSALDFIPPEIHAIFKQALDKSGERAWQKC